MLSVNPMSEQKQIHSDALSQYLDLRTEYVDRLREQDLLNASGGVRREIVEGLLGGRAVPVEGSPLDEHCRKHPDDPLCQRITLGNAVGQFLEVRSEFLKEVAERDLGSVQRFVADMGGARTADGKPLPLPFAGSVGNVGLVGPDDDIDDIPPWLRPYVTSRLFDGLPQPMPFDRLGSAVGNAGLVTPEQGLGGVPPWLRPYVNPGRAFSDGTPVPLPFRRNEFAGALLF